MKKYSLLGFFFLIILSLQCKREADFIDDTVPYISPREIFTSDNIQIDRNTKLLYFSYPSTVATYNYQTEERRRISEDFRLSFSFDVGYYEGTPEVYIGQINRIYILDGITLTLWG